MHGGGVEGMPETLGPCGGGMEMKNVHCGGEKCGASGVWRSGGG